MASEHPSPLPTPADRHEPAPIQSRSAPLSLRTVDAEGFQLERLDREDYIPSVKPWIRYSSAALLAGAGLAFLFIAVMPYRVVVRGNGAVRPTGELVLINAPFDGRVRSIHVRPNQRVQTGQAVVELDSGEGQNLARQFQQGQEALSRQEQAQSSQTSAELAGAELEVEKARSALQLAESEFRRYAALSQTGAVPQQVYDEKKAVADQARSSLAQSYKRLEEIRSRARTTGAMLERERATLGAGLREAQRRLLNGTVRSPVSGVVFKVDVRNPLQTVSAGQALVSLAPSDAEPVVKAAVRGEDIDNIQPGQHAELRLQGCPYPDFGTLPATVIAISPDALPADESAHAGGGSGFYEVTLRPTRLTLRAGTRSCQARIGMALLADITTRQESLLRFVLRKTRMLVGN